MIVGHIGLVFFFKQKTAYEMRISDWSSDVCSSDLDDQWPAKTVAGWINAQKEEARRPQHMQDQGDYTQRQFVRVYTAYQLQCDRQGVVDFAELLLRAFELTRDNAELQRHYRARFRHILVDEFQDTNKLQYDRSEEHTSELQSLMRISY